MNDDKNKTLNMISSDIDEDVLVNILTTKGLATRETVAGLCKTN